MKPIIKVENVGKRYMIGHNRIQGKNTVQFHIPRLSIYPGVYNITLSCGKNDALSDELRDAVELQILPGAYNHSQRVNDSNLSLTTFDYSAKINGKRRDGD